MIIIIIEKVRPTGRVFRQNGQGTNGEMIPRPLSDITEF